MLSVTTASDPLILLLTPEPPPLDPGPDFPLTAGGARLTLRLDAGSLARIAGPWAQVPAPDDLPTPLRAALTEVRLRPLLDALRDGLGIDATLDDEALTAERDAGAAWYSIGLVPVDAASRLPVGWLCCDDNAAAALAQAIAALPASPPATPMLNWRALPAYLTLELARLALTRDELRQLAPEDVVLLPPDAPIARGTVILRQGTRALAAASLVQDRLKIQRRLGATMQADETGDALDDALEPTGEQPASGGSFPATEPSTAEQMADAPDQGPISVDELEVRLDFDIGHLRLSLGEIERLAPGSVLALDTPAGRPVRIRAGGRVIGRGELVQIDDRLGVVVRELRIGDEHRSA